MEAHLLAVRDIDLLDGHYLSSLYTMVVEVLLCLPLLNKGGLCMAADAFAAAPQTDNRETATS